MKKLLKVLSKDMLPLIQGGEPYELGKLYVCDDFDESSQDCSRGFYGIPASQLIHYHQPDVGTRVFECAFDGREKIFSDKKQRYEKMIILRELSREEVISECKKIENDLGYSLSKALYPINPLLLPTQRPTEKEIENLKLWASVYASAYDSVWASVYASAYDSVWASVYAWVYASVYTLVWASVYESLYDSVYDSVYESFYASVYTSVSASAWAYIGSLFYDIKKWEYIDHEPGIYPFQPLVDLWIAGFVPSFDGKVWRLHSGENAEIVYVMTAPKGEK